jgi:AAA15 family ATPase/GTPase
MLIQITIGNFLSFKDPITFSMVASRIKEHENSNVFLLNEKVRLLKSAVIYGANASGKSNFFKAMAFFRNFILTSSKETPATDEIKVTNFKLSTETENKPSLFEIVFLHEGIRYRYGFQVDKKEVHKEWFYYAPKRQEAKLFIREGSNIEIGSYYKEGKGLVEKTRNNALFLSVVAQFNGQISLKIIDWFTKFNIISGLDDINYLPYTVKQAHNDEVKEEILKFLKISDLGIENILIEEEKMNRESLPKDMPDAIKGLFPTGQILGIKIKFMHRKFDADKNHFSFENFDFGSEESEGTKKLFALSGPLLDTFKNGKILLIDEFDSRLHPLITDFLVKLFNSAENRNNAQFIFASHDTNLFRREFFRRDQIWFIEKDKYGASDLYSLVEYIMEKGKVRHDASYGKDYILGKYGAIPFLGDPKLLFK